MKIRKVGSNMTELTFDQEAGCGTCGQRREVTVLISYDTPVACHSEVTMEFYRTEYKWSPTTTRHINKWLREQGQPGNVVEKPQAFFDEMVAGLEY